MKLFIKNVMVQKNIALFKKILSRHLDDCTFRFHAFVDRKTGELLFTEEMTPTEQLNLKRWKGLNFFYRPPSGKEEKGCFEILEDEGGCRLFELSELDIASKRVLSELVCVLNTSIAEIQGTKTVGDVYSEIIRSELELPGPNQAGKDLVHEAWHSVDRMEAERLLEKERIGTYLFRKDEYATILEEQLSSRFREPVKCLTLTYLNDDRRVCDLTFVGKGGRWFIYDNDPTLENRGENSIQALFKSLRSILTQPLLFGYRDSE